MSEFPETVGASHCVSFTPAVIKPKLFQQFFSGCLFKRSVSLTKSIRKPVKNTRLFFLRKVWLRYLKSTVKPVKNKNAFRTRNSIHFPPEHFSAQLNNPLRPTAHHNPFRQP